MNANIEINANVKINIDTSKQLGLWLKDKGICISMYIYIHIHIYLCRPWGYMSQGLYHDLVSVIESSLRVKDMSVDVLPAGTMHRLR